MKAKSKNRSSERSRRISQSYGRELKTSLALGFSFLAFCFQVSPALAEISSEQLDPTNLLTPHLAELSQDVNTLNVRMQVAKLQSGRQQQSQVSDTAPVNFITQVDKKLPQSVFTSAADPDSRAKRQLWQARISIPKNEKDKRSKNELLQIIRQISSVEFEPQSRIPEPAIVARAAPTTKSNETLSDAETPGGPKEKQIESEQPYEPSPSERMGKPITDQTLQLLKNLSQRPEKLDNPLELGEVLFLSGRLKEAVMCYQQALNRRGPDEADSTKDRAWILFQIGNCLRNRDRPAAKKVYRQLIAEYPDSPWTDLAKTREKLLEWYQKDKPLKLIAERQF